MTRDEDNPHAKGLDSGYRDCGKALAEHALILMGAKHENAHAELLEWYVKHLASHGNWYALEAAANWISALHQEKTEAQE